jgi:photosystem II stability/assembly factor-like uncharacterized protein
MSLRIRKTCLSLVFLGFLGLDCASAQTWRPLGPPGGDARTLAIDPLHPERVYLGTTAGHVFASRDGGEHWERLGSAGMARNAVITSIVVDPRDSATLFASAWTPEPDGEGGGIYASHDGGLTWHESGLAGLGLRALIQSLSNPDILVAGGLDGVFRSSDAGRTWERISPAGDAELRNFDALAMDPLNPGVIYAGTFHLPWKTTDGGEHWIPIHEGMIDDSDVLSLAVDRSNPERIFASACSGIYRSGDSGMHWKKVQGIPFSSRRTPVIQLDPSHPGTLFAGTTEGLWKSVDDGLTWRRISPGDWAVNSLAFSARPSGAQAGSRLLAGTEQFGVLASDDGGEHFRLANIGFDHRRILSLAADLNQPGHIAAALAGAPDAIVVTEDGGGTWSALGTGLGADSVRHVFYSPAGWLAALASGGLEQFDPSTGIWSRIGAMRGFGDDTPRKASKAKGISEQVFSAHVNDLVFADAGWFAATAEGLFVSRDAGFSWAAMPIGPGGLPVDSVRVSSDGQKIRVVSSGGMVFSDDAGRSWQWHDLPFESGGATRVEFLNGTTAIAASRAGLYISRDAGASWHIAGAGVPAASVQDLIARSGLWLVSLGGGGIYVSRDSGMNWSRVRGMPGSTDSSVAGQVDILTAEAGSGSIYAGMANDGLYVLDLATAPAVASNVETDR